jgi:hypothetical protein
MDIPLMNCFCRRFDLVFIEMGQVKGKPVYWFVDFANQRRYYTNEEIVEKTQLNVAVLVAIEGRA